ncbi:MAG TPA: hypothetical protein VGM25_11435 [Caulobacteraceae bacterium]|jgi:hypothetical protein
MPISFPFFLLAKPLAEALRWIRTDLDPPLPGLSPGEAERVRLERVLARRLPPHLARDVLRDE